jgi:hypothetical protein
MNPNETRVGMKCVGDHTPGYTIGGNQCVRVHSQDTPEVESGVGVYTTGYTRGGIRCRRSYPTIHQRWEPVRKSSQSRYTRGGIRYVGGVYPPPPDDR